jgi:hypothetical protein
LVEFGVGPAVLAQFRQGVGVLVGDGVELGGQFVDAVAKDGGFSDAGGSGATGTTSLTVRPSS